MIIGVRVARWFIFKPKIPIWVNFGGPWIGIFYILWQFGIFYGHLGHFGFIWGILCSFGTFFRVWESYSMINLAILIGEP
jgi:hypothetical protein